jgi:hypothetical protein
MLSNQKKCNIAFSNLASLQEEEYIQNLKLTVGEDMCTKRFVLRH